MKNPRTICSWNEVPVVIDTVIVARILGYTVDYTRRMLQSGRIPARKMGKDWRVTKDALRAYLEEATNQQPGT